MTRHYAFADLALDRAAHFRADAQQLKALIEARAARSVFVLDSGKVLITRDEPRLLSVPLGLLRDHFEDRHFSYLGNDAEQSPWFALSLSEDAGRHWQAQFDAEPVDLRSAASLLSQAEAGAAAYARSLLHWQLNARFCSRCGARTLLAAGGHRALCTDAACAAEFFPRTDAAIITIVHDGERCLLGRQPGWPEKRFSTLAGFLEPGESLEAAVRREVFEEVGVQVGDCQYFASQPWPFPASIMVGFIARAESREIRLSDEIVEAHWFTADELEAKLLAGEIGISPRLSISRALIEHWFESRAGRALRLP